jgi:glycosyltransferase involved in cell wall biosynthesis
MSGAPRLIPSARPDSSSFPGERGAPEISLVVPVYNERDNLAPLTDEMMKVMEDLGRSFEVLFVNDGSTDGSDIVLKSLRTSDPRIRILTFESNSGLTAAMAAGFGAARGEIIVTLDADLQIDCHDIPLLLEKLASDDAVVGYRARRKDTWVRRASSRIANAVRNAVSEDDIIDTGCSLKAFRREALSSIKLYTGMHRFIPTLLRMEGYRVCQVRVSHRPRLSGQSKYNIRNRLLCSFIDLLAVRWMKRRMLRYRVTEEK